MTGTTRIWVLLAVLALLGAGVFLLFQTGPLQVGLPEPPPAAEPEAPPAIEPPRAQEEPPRPAVRRELPILSASRSEDPEWKAALGGVKGRILEHDGAPAAGLEVEAAGDWLPVLMEGLRSLLALEEGSFQPNFAATRTDGEGRFLLRGFYPRETALLRIAEQGETLLTHPLPGAPAAGEVLDIGELRLPRFATVTGRVEDQETGEPVAGARVWVSCLPGIVPATGFLDLRGGEWLLGDFGDRNAGPAVFRLPRALGQVRRHMALPGGLTDREGRFTLHRVNPGRASLMAEKEGYQTARELSFPVAPGRVRDMGTVTITRENRIQVLVKEAGGRPARGVEVLAGVTPALIPVAIMRSIGISDESGAASATGFPDGRVYLAGRKPGRAWSVAGPFAQGEELVLTLSGGCQLAFDCVAAGEDGRKPGGPVEPDRVLLTTLLDHTSLPGYATVERGGRILLEDLPEGIFLLRVSAAGFLDALEVVRAKAGAPGEPARIVLEPEHFLEVAVRDGGGRALPGVRLLPIADDLMIRSGAHLRAPHIQAFFTDPLGRVRVGPLAKGKHKLGLWHPRHGECMVDAVVPAAAPLVVTLLSGRIEGWVEPAGPPASGGRWLAYLAGESVRPLTATTVSAEGLFTFEGVAPGRWEVLILEEKPSQPLEALIFSVATRAHEPAGHQGGVEVQAGQTARVVVRLAGAGPAAGAVEGVVRLGGRPAEGFLVVAESGPRRVTGTTGADGTYRLEGVPAGKCNVRAGLFDRGFEGEVRRIASALVEVGAGARARQDFDLPGGSIEGMVKDGQGRPVAGAHVRAKAIRAEGAPGGIDALTDGEGRFAMPCAAPGLWEIRLQGETVAARAPTRVELAPGQERARVELVALAKVPALIRLEPPPTAGAQFRMLRWRPTGAAEAGESGWSPVDRDGQIRINGLPGPLELEYWEKDSSGGTWLRRGQVVVPENPSGPIQVVLGPVLSHENAFPRVAFAGEFQDQGGKGLGPGKLTLYKQDRVWFAPEDQIPACQVDAEGRFSLAAPAGRYGYRLDLEGPRRGSRSGQLEIPAGGQLGAVIQTP